MHKLRKQVIFGTFIHSKTRQELEYLHDAAIFVDGDGKIAKIAENSGNWESALQHLEELGWDKGDVAVAGCQEGQFFFPGFLGEFSV